MLEEIPGVIEISVRRILKEPNPPGSSVTPQFGTGKGKELAVDPWFALHRDPGQPPEAGSPDNPEKNGLGLIIPMVPC